MNDFFPLLCILLTGFALALHFGLVKAFLRRNTLETRKLELELRSIKTRLILLTSRIWNGKNKSSCKNRSMKEPPKSLFLSTKNLKNWMKMNMNKLSKHIIIAIITITTIAGCIYAGNVERNDAVLSGMSMEKYQYIHDRIGGRASSSDVVKEYLRNQGFYDSKDY